MEVSGVKTYPLSFIEHLDSQITQTLPQVLINSLSFIKENNKFINRRTPRKINLHYKTSDNTNWRDNSKSKDNMNALLNKLSGNNYDKLKVEIVSSLEGQDLNTEFCESIYTKCITQPEYCNIYVRLLKEIINDSSILIQKSNDDVGTFWESIKDLDLSVYENLCTYNKTKDKIVGIHVMLGYLYRSEMIDFSMINTVYDSIIKQLQEVEKDNHKECMVESIKGMSEVVLPIIKERDIENYNIIHKNLSVISKDRKLLKARLRFLLLDVLDL